MSQAKKENAMGYRSKRAAAGILGWVVVGAGLLGCGGETEKPAAPRNIVDNSAALATLIATRTTADITQPDPDAVYWDSVVGGTVTLMAQPMVAPRPETTTTEAVQVQALHDGERIAFRLRWKDAEKSEGGHLGEFSDAMALEFPMKDGPLPPVMMGTVGMPVQLYHWRAQYQHDKEHGKPTTNDLYPNASVDMYPHEFKEAPGSSPEAATKYSPAKAVGNPQSFPKTGVDVIAAEGFGSSAVQESDGAVGRAVWADGMWTLVITRPLVSARGSTLKAGTGGNIAFAAWQGGHGEVGSRKCVTMQWTPVEIR